MDKNTLKKIRSELINKFQDGVTIEQLCDTYSAKWGDIYDMISICLRHSIDNISDIEKYKIKNLYESGVSTTKIGVQFNLHHKQVRKILNELNVKKNNKCRRKHNLDENYFDIIDTQNKAYILGFLYADGYNSIDKLSIRLQLQEEDREILEKMRFELKSDKELIFIQCDNKVASNGYISKNMYNLEIYSKHMCQQLDSLGMHQNKSMILTFPEWLSEDLYSHFIRGYFDGDGSYCHRIDPKYGDRDLITFTSTNDFCLRLKEIINTYTLAKGGGIYDCSSHNGITKVLSFSGVNQTRIILDWLYKDADLYLTRKYEKYQNRFAA